MSLSLVNKVKILTEREKESREKNILAMLSMGTIGHGW